MKAANCIHINSLKKDGILLYEQNPQWPQVLEISRELKKHHFECFLAGGCVRDLLMGIAPQDFDIASNATPDEILKIFPKALGIGKEFGVMVLAFEGFQIEIASFRTDGVYHDGRRPSSIQFVGPDEDALRRDFTINALFFDIQKLEVVDYVQGLEDLKNKIIRCVGRAEDRFTQDKLRMLRAIRFKAQLGFELDNEIILAIQKMSSQIKLVSQERIHDEFFKLFKSKQSFEALPILKLVNLMPHIHKSFEEFNSHNHWTELGTDIFKLDQMNLDSNLKAKLGFLCLFSVFFNESESKLKNLLKFFKFSNSDISIFEFVYHKYGFLSSLLHENWDHLESQQKFEILSIFADSKLEYLKAYFLLKNVQKDLWAKTQLKVQDYLLISDGNSNHFKLPQPWVMGEDLKKLQIPTGPKFGKILNHLFQKQVLREFQDKNQALLYLTEHKGDNFD